ncbi:hypothetical protein DEJ48_38855 [Streptomyces venezuelae]|uniref:Uncharacterized protein n=1 Tax=Streptomyces venezuelae TaxID=54571 RepID=A0A5P2CCV0_STRVZ|nr:hypothetical protein [Streptomyces venezuelae]QES38579.1 hypothetical protein DEJ48_38855 [Streptomyces venezuelae]
MPLLHEYTCTATPGRRVLEVYDAETYLGDTESLHTAEEQVVAGERHHLYLVSLQPTIKAQVSIRIWDTVPQVPADAEGRVPVTIESRTGTLVVNELEFGPAGETNLPRPGVYEGHAWWRGRQAAGDYYDSYFDQETDDWTLEQTRSYFAQCPAGEHYVLDLAYHREPDPLDANEAGN